MSVGVSSQPASQLLPNERIELILSQLDRLPTLPPVAARLLSVTTSDQTSARDVVELIELDASLTALILRMVRRADLGVGATSMNVARAVTLLGFNAVRNAVLSVQLFEAFSRPDETELAASRRRALWQHSLAVACLSEMIGERVGATDDAGMTFICGLLHDIGKIALDTCLPKSYTRVVERAERSRASICDVEREVFGLDHTVAGKRLAARWGLPQAVLECVWFHHQSPEALPSSLSCGRLVRIVHLADHVAHRAGFGFSGYRHVDDVDELARELGLDAAAMSGMLEQVPARIEPFCELLGLDDAASRAEYATYLVAANERLSRVNAELLTTNRALETRSTALAALENLTGRLTERAGIGDVCVAAAETLRTMAGVDCAVAFRRRPSDRYVYIGCARAPDQGSGDSLVAAGNASDITDGLLNSTFVAAPGLIPAPNACVEIWRRGAGANPRDALWLLPLVAGEVPVGGVMVAACEQAVQGLRSRTSGCDILANAVVSALIHAEARAESERISEELLDVNRRLSAAQRELIRNRSISMIAAMAAGAAHELNNPLSVISGRAQMLLAGCDDAESARALRIVIEQTERATQLVTDLMHFAKPEPPQPSVQRLGDVLESLCQHWRAGSSLRDEQMTLSIADPSLTVYADAEQLKEMLHAAVANAVEAMKAETARLHVNSPSRASDETVRIVIEDNGVGMRYDVLEQALDPFFSSRPAGRGRGLGLSRAYRLAEINGGYLSLESTPDVGTIVTIELPARAPAS